MQGIVQIQGLTAEMLLKRFDNLESQIKELKTPQPQATEKLITRFEASVLLGVSLVTIHNWTKSGVITAYRVGNKVRFKENEVFASLKQINSKR
jgi:excisionase family DNA binding protein